MHATYSSAILSPRTRIFVCRAESRLSCLLSVEAVYCLRYFDTIYVTLLLSLPLSGIIYDASSETMQDIDHVDGSKHTSAFGKSICILSVAV